MPTFGKPGVSWLHAERLDIFVRSREGTLVHTWLEKGAHDAIDLGGSLDLYSEPVAVRREPQDLHVFAMGGLRLLHWRWAAELGRMVGPEELPGFITSKPVPVADGDKLYVFSSDLGGRLRVWESAQDKPWSLTTVDRISTGSNLVAVRRGSGLIDVYTNPFGIEHRALIGEEWQEPVRLPRSETLEPGIVSIAAIAPEDEHHFIRQDVYGRQANGTLLHWGFGFFPSSDPTRWFGPDPTRQEPIAFDPSVVTMGIDSAEIFFRDAQSVLHHWSWNFPTRTYDDVGPVGDGCVADPAAVVRGFEAGSRGPFAGIDVVAQTGDDTVTVWSRNKVAWSRQSWQLPSPRAASGALLPEPAQDTIVGSTDDVAPAFLVTRPADHVVLGLHAPGYRLDTRPAPRLVAESPDAHLVVTFPPQHIAEEVSKLGESAMSGNVRQARLAGSTRVAFTAPAEIDLTSAGLLAALNGASVDPDEQRSAIELPWGLIVAPRAGPDGRPVITRHPVRPVDSDGTTGLWRTRLGTAAGDGGLQIKGLRAGRSDPFPLPLSKANRVNISGQSSPAHASRLELSSLGGSLTASGKWRTLEWDHHAVCGRDQRVRTATKGMLYPLGHRAVFVETTQRSASEPVAVLRKTRTLFVTEAVRNLDDLAGSRDTALKRAFPFSEVELVRLEFPNLDDAVWQTAPRPTAEIAHLQDSLDRIRFEANALFDAIFGPDALLAGVPHVEDLAAGLDDNPNEPLDPDDPKGPTRSSAARAWLAFDATAKTLQQTIDLLRNEHFDTEQIETFFVPTFGGATVAFPVRCREAVRDVHFDLPLLFVAELELSDDVRQRFNSLSDPTVLVKLHDSYTRMRAGVVDLPGVQINLSPTGGAAAPGDVQEVYRLNIVGNARESGGFLPSLGRTGEAGSWAAEIALLTMRTLLGRDPRVQINFDEAYLSGADSDIPLRILGEVAPGVEGLKPLDIDFTANTDRSGGLAAPKYVADGISRVKGLVNVAGAQSLDPMKLFSEGASLFGFDLRDLIKDIKEAPEVVTILTEGAPPEVRMTWKDIDLAESAKGFIPLFDNDPEHPERPTSRLTLTVVSSPTLNEATCTLTNFKLAMPPGSNTIIELSFGKVEFRQRTGQPPTLELEGIGAEFVGKLALLQTLQEKVGLGKLAPQVKPSPTNIVARYAIPVPDVKAFSFVMSNLTFSAALTVPYGKEPVSVALGFASRERPFTLTVLMFGGGGYLDLELVHTGLRRLEVSLQFGAAIAIGFGLGSAEVHAFGGIRYAMVGHTVSLTGFIHIGGSVQLLGLVAISVELQVELAYQFDTNALVGRAKVVIEIDITLYSDSIELDSGEWVIAGGNTSEPLPPSPPSPPGPVLFAAPPKPDEAALQAWRSYRGAFA